MKPSEADVRASLSRILSCSTTREVCQGLTQLIDSCGSQNLELIFEEIMDDITHVRSMKWGLRRENVNSEDSMRVREFMGLQGPLFRLINRMMQHELLCCGPIHYQSQYHEGSSRMSSFEAYFLYLAHFITGKPTSVDLSQVASGSQYNSGLATSEEEVTDALYFMLLDEYLSCYFPISSDAKSAAVNLGTPLKSSSKPYHAFAKSSSLLRHNSTKAPSCHGETLGCDVLSQLFSKVWMEDFFNKIGGNMEKKAPNQNHVRAIRLLVKHIHFYCNAHTENIRHLQSESLWEQVNPNIMNRFSPVLYDFLCHCFDIWPRDETFRIVLETWLSFIQPWRYVKMGALTGSASSVSNDWYYFVYENKRFYSALFQAVIRKLKCMDLSTYGNSLLLFRVAKVFGQRNLITLIDQANENEISRSYGSYLMASRKSASDDNMFSAEFTDVVRRFMDIISQTLESVNCSNEGCNENDFSAKTLQFLGYGALLDPKSRSDSISDKEKTQKNLNYAMEFLADVYDLPIPKVAASVPSSPTGKLEIADHELDVHGKMTLSPTGRYQLRNNLRKFPISLNTDPEHWPICGYESAFLVRFLYSLASRFNKRYQCEMDSLCRKRNLIGKLSRYILIPQSQYRQFNINDEAKPRLSLRFLAHYRNGFYLVLLYLTARLFGFSFSWSLICIFCFIVLFVFIQALFSSEK